MLLSLEIIGKDQIKDSRNTIIEWLIRIEIYDYDCNLSGNKYVWLSFCFTLIC